MFAFEDRRGAVEVAFTDRHGPTGDLLARDPAELPAVGDRLATAARTWPAAAGVTHVVLMHQVHGAEVAVVGAPPPERPPEADALVTGVAGTMLVARAADCVPVLVADPEQGLVAAVHAGRAGVLAGVVPAALEALRRLGAGRLVGWVGPHACGRCYEVPGELRAEVSAAVPASWSVTSWGTPALDLGAGVEAQLRAGGAEVVRVGRCTLEDADLHSHRRDGSRSGRHAGLVWVRG